MRNEKLTRLILLSLLALYATSPAALAQGSTRQSVWDAVYSGAQAERGRAEYVVHCVMCHGPALEGNGEAPPLTGEFIPDWAGTSLADLFGKISLTMPLNAPGTLTSESTADILAYILKVNNFPAGTKDLPVDKSTLAAISFDVSKPIPVTPRAKRAHR
jgi:mono/diheme cytochrome c family protein